MNTNVEPSFDAPAEVPAGGSRAGPQSVGRILGILEWLAEHRDGATLSELAAAVGAPKTSLVGLLAGLASEGGVDRDEAGRYRLGMRMLGFAMRATSGQDLATLARPVLQALVATTGETAALGTIAPDAEMAVYVAKVESSNPVRYTVSLGERRELYCTAIGKALLASFDDERLARYLKEQLRRQYTATTLTRDSDLVRELQEIRRSGIASTKDERVAGASGIAAPILSREGKVVAALVVAGPSQRMRANGSLIRRSVKAAAAECSRFVGANS